MRTFIFLALMAIITFFTLLSLIDPPTSDDQMTMIIIMLAMMCNVPGLLILLIKAAYETYVNHVQLAKDVHEQEELWHMSDL